MSKNKGFDVIAEAHERANHNINPYYWFNRVTTQQMAGWRITKMFSPLYFVMYTLTGNLVFKQLNRIAVEQNKSLFSVLFDFSDSTTSSRFTGIVLFSFFWVVFGIGTVQSVLRWIFAPPAPKLERKRDRKKKQPKRPKNYK